MNCPVDNTTLMMTERQGIEIDYCPKCRGVWLDRGELDKLIERTATVADADDWDDRYDERHRPRQEYPAATPGRYPPHKTKRRSLLGELFDID